MTTQKQFIRTEDLEQLANELFGSGMAPLPRDPLRRRSVLAAEFSRAHITIPGVSRRDESKFAALGTPFRAIAASRQARVDAFIAALEPRPTVDGVRARLVKIFGERALVQNLLHARKQIAFSLMLISELEGDAQAKVPDDLSQAARLLADKLEAFGAREKHIARGQTFPTFGSGLALLSELTNAVLDNGETSGTSPKSVPAAPSASPKPSPRTPAKASEHPPASPRPELRGLDRVEAALKKVFSR